MSRPLVQREAMLAHCAAVALTLEAHPVIALGLRGGLSGVVNKIGGFDDVLVVLTKDLCQGFTGNTDPSSEVAGRANLIAGISWFKPGFHHPGTPKQYAAFVQDGAIDVQRWQTADVQEGTVDPVRGKCLGNGLWRGDFAIHIHDAMGVTTTGSEGCQTVIKTEWPAYYALLSSELSKANLARFPYLLVEPPAALANAA